MEDMEGKFHPDNLTSVGEILFSFDRVHWKIPNFHSIEYDLSHKIRSPRFSFHGRDWRVCIYPQGISLPSSGFLDMLVTNLSFVQGGLYEKFIILVGIAGTLHKSIVHAQASSVNGRNYYIPRLIQSAVLIFQKNYMVPNGDLHLFFEIEKTGDSAKRSVAWVNAKDGIRKLQEDQLEIFQNQNFSDVTFIIDDKKIRSHRCILGARSPVFKAMFMHDTKEKISGVVDIQGIEMDIFLNFLNYLYTGHFESNTSDNIQKLYIVADRYQVEELKKACMREMLQNIDDDNFFDLYALSLRHNEEDLMDACIQYFMAHALAIIETSKWLAFFNENPEHANRLLIRHLQSFQNP